MLRDEKRTRKSTNRQAENQPEKKRKNQHKNKEYCATARSENELSAPLLFQPIMYLGMGTLCHGSPPWR